jgi:phosphatidylglycerophosphate synthase
MHDRARLHIVPNLLSLARVPLGLMLWIAPAVPAWTLTVVAAAALSDMLDGWFARRARRRLWERHHDPGALAASAARGALIDGAADKFFVVSAVLVLAWTLRPDPWVLVFLASRELLFVPVMVAYRMVPGALRRTVDFTAGRTGKTATLAQFVALVLGLLGSPLFVSAAVTAGLLGVLATLGYLVRPLMGTTSVEAREHA